MANAPVYSFGHPCEHQLRRTCIGGISCPLNGFPDTWCCSWVKGKINFKRDKPCEGPRCRWGFVHPTQQSFDTVTQLIADARAMCQRFEDITNEGEGGVPNSTHTGEIIDFKMDPAHYVDSVYCNLHFLRIPAASCGRLIGQMFAYAAVKTHDPRVFTSCLRTMKKPVDVYLIGAYQYIVHLVQQREAKYKDSDNGKKKKKAADDVLEELKSDIVDIMNSALSSGGQLVDREEQQPLQYFFLQALRSFPKAKKKQQEMLMSAGKKFSNPNLPDSAESPEREKAAARAAAAPALGEVELEDLPSTPRVGKRGSSSNAGVEGGDSNATSIRSADGRPMPPSAVGVDGSPGSSGDGVADDPAVLSVSKEVPVSRSGKATPPAAKTPSKATAKPSPAAPAPADVSPTTKEPSTSATGSSAAVAGSAASIAMAAAAASVSAPTELPSLDSLSAQATGKIGKKGPTPAPAAPKPSAPAPPAPAAVATTTSPAVTPTQTPVPTCKPGLSKIDPSFQPRHTPYFPITAGSDLPDICILGGLFGLGPKSARGALLGAAPLDLKVSDSPPPPSGSGDQPASTTAATRTPPSIQEDAVVSNWHRDPNASANGSGGGVQGATGSSAVGGSMLFPSSPSTSVAGSTTASSTATSPQPAHGRPTINTAAASAGVGNRQPSGTGASPFGYSPLFGGGDVFGPSTTSANSSGAFGGSQQPQPQAQGQHPQQQRQSEVPDALQDMLKGWN